MSEYPFRAIVLTVFLMVAAPAGVVSLSGEATAEPRAHADTITATTPRIDETPRQFGIPDPEQTVVVSPGTESSFVAGGIYTALVSVNVSTLGALESITTSNKISSPRLSVSVSTSGPAEKATLVGISTEGEGGYNAPSSDSFPDDSLTLDSSSAFAAGTQRTVVVRFKIDRDDPPEELTLSVDPTPQESNGDRTVVSYEVTQSVTQSAAMARTAGARAQLAAGYLESYNTLLRQEPWNNRFKQSMSEAFTIVANDAAQSLVTGYTDEALAEFTSVTNANNLASVQNAQTAYGMSQNKYGSSTVGRIAQLNEELYNDLNDRIATDTVQRSGNASYALRELQSLSEQEQTAWRNGNRQRVRTILYKKQYVLTGRTSNPQQIANYIQDDPAYPQSFDNRFDPKVSEQFAPDDPSLRAQARSLQGAAEDEGKPKLHGYFTGLKKFSNSQAEYIEQTALPLARDPAPSVTVSPSRSTLQSQLSNLQADESLTATFEIENNGGVTSSQGYLSVSTAQGLNVTGFEQISGDGEVAVTNYSVGDGIYDKGATQRTPARFPLTDIREQYDSGETNQYKLTITNETASAGSAWITYRTAFEPLIHADGDGGATAATFSRYPNQNQVRGTDQQNFPVFNLSAEPDDTNQPPIAQVTNSQTSAQLETTVSVSGAQSTDDGGISSYEWRVYDATSGTQLSGPKSGQEASFSFASPGSKNVTLSVTDSRGLTDTDSQILTVEPTPSVSPSFEANRTFIEPDSATQLRASTGAESYAWDLDGDGSYDDASGPSRTTVWTPTTPGDAELGLRVTTADGRQATARLRYTVENATEQLTAPTPVIDGPSTVSVGETVTLDASNSTDQTVSGSREELVAGSISKYEWESNSSGTIDATGASVSTSFESAGSYVVNLTVTDTDGYTSSTQLLITVTQTDSSDENGEFVDLSPGDLPGDGSESNPYQISNVSELQAMEDDLGANYMLVSDIDASITAQINNGSRFDPVGSSASRFSSSGSRFTGSFDGNNHTVTGLTINRPNESNVGLFGVIGAYNNGATVRNITLTNVSITGNNNVGGLVGINNGFNSNPKIQNSRVSGNITGDKQVGGLAGQSITARISNATASVSVNGDEHVGGLVGRNGRAGSIQIVRASGSVVGEYEVGGLIGENGYRSTVQNASAFGSVTSEYRAGGLVGRNRGSIQDTFAVGFVNATGELNGPLQSEPGEGLVGESDGGVEQSYFDEQATGQSKSDTGRGLTTAQMQGEGARTNMSGLDFQTWTTTDGYPSLRALPGKIERSGGGSDNNDDAIPPASISFNNQTVSNESQTVTIDSAQFGNRTVPGEEFVVVVHETTSTSIGYGTGTNIGAKVGESDVLSAGTHTNITVDLSTAVGSSDNLAELTSAELTGSQLLVAMLYRANRTTIDEGRVNHGARITQDRFPVTSRAQIIIKNNLPGDGTQSNPYQISNVSELQAMEDDLDANYELVSDIDASNTAQFNDERGFDPVGGAKYRGSTPPAFSGSFNGNNHTITGLTINRPTESYVGLFGFSTGTITNVTLTNATVTGTDFVGGLVGNNYEGLIDDADLNGVERVETGSIQGVRFSGDVTGSSLVGGLVGRNQGSIQNATAIASVNGSNKVGGLVGDNTGGGNRNTGNIQTAIATGSVSGERAVGGLVGRNNEGTIRETFAVGPVTGTDRVGGLVGGVGFNSGIVEQSYFDTEATGQSTSAGSAIGLATTQMQGEGARTNMDGLDFQTTWTTTDGYPSLHALPGEIERGGSGGGNNDDVIPPASISFNNQTVSNGSQTVTVESAQFGNQTVPGEAFVVVVHRATDSTYGTETEIGAKIGESVVVSAGSRQNITVNLSRTLGSGSEDSTTALTGSQTLVAMLHRANTTDGTNVNYGTAITRDRSPVTDRATITVPSGAGSTIQVDVDLSDLSGDGSESDPYEISNASELQAMENKLDASYVLVSDINASTTARADGGAGFNPVGSNDSAQFTGIFDGANHTINGLTINRSNTEHTGLFGVIGARGDVRAVRLTNATVDGRNSAGVLAGSNLGIVQNVSVTGNVTGRNGVGGLVGSNEGVVRQSFASVQTDGLLYVGGLIGSNQPDARIARAGADGRVDGFNNVGGLAGGNVGGTVTRTFAAGQVTGATIVGGLTSRNDGDITASYADEQATGQSIPRFFDGVIGLDTAQMQGTSARTNMDRLDFTNTWTTTDGYPALRALPEADTESDEGGSESPPSENPFPNGVPGVSGGSEPPTDVDDDGKFEDINGDEELTFADAIALAFAQTDGFTPSQRTAIDFDTDGDVDFDDAIALAFE